MRRFPLLRRLTPLTLALAAMAILLGVLAVLQYQWVGRLSADERDRLRTHVSVQADSLSDDFNRELTRAFFWLQFGAELRRDTPLESEADRYARWYTAAPRPELIKAIYRVTEPTKDGAPWLLERFTREPVGLEPVAWPTELEPLRAAMQEARQARGRADKQPIRVPATWAGVPALVIPRIVQVDEHHEGGRMLSMVTPAHGYTIAVLDAAVIKRDILPQLVERHFKLSEDPTLFVGVYGPGGFAYTAPEGPVPITLQTAPDIKQGDLFEVRFREFTRFVADRRFTQAPPAPRPHPEERARRRYRLPVGRRRRS